MASAISNEYRGKFHHKMDPKNRVAIPSELRPENDEALYLLESHREGQTTLKALTSQKLRGMELAVQSRNDISEALKDTIIGKLSADCVMVSINPQGKLLIPKRLCDHAALKSNVVLVGRGDYFEIWSPQFFEAAQEAELAKLATINAELGFF